MGPTVFAPERLSCRLTDIGPATGAPILPVSGVRRYQRRGWGTMDARAWVIGVLASIGIGLAALHATPVAAAEERQFANSDDVQLGCKLVCIDGRCECFTLTKPH